MTKLQIGILAIGLLAFTTCQAQSGLMDTVVINFSGTNGQSPGGELVQRNDGLLYGSTSAGGAFGWGTIFKTTLDGSLTTLFSFNGTNGANPYSAPLLAPDGSSYGFTQYGGNGFDGNYVSGQGTIYQLGSNGVLDTLVAFNGTNGCTPTSLIPGDDGSFYGTTAYGGAFTNDSGGQGDGCIFETTTNGDLTLLASFDGTNGANPSTLIQANDGDFYGVTQSGGSYTNGTVFQMTPNGDVTTLFSFNGTNGSQPNSLIQGSDGTLYGTTVYGGSLSDGTAYTGDGTVFRISTNGDFTLLASFDHTTSISTSGSFPTGKLLEVSNGVFYGTCDRGGPSYAFGTLFEVSTNGLSLLLAFYSGAGALPGYLAGGVIKATDGNYYGVAGSWPDGGVYAVRPAEVPVIQASLQAGQINLTWNAWAGYSYTVFSQTNAALPLLYWNNIWFIDEDDVNHFSAVAGTNGPMSFSDPIEPDAQRFYQVIMSP